MPANYVCACGKRFRRREHLNRHARANHSSSRPHVCGICQRAYARSDVLKRHLAHHQSSCTLRAAVACDRCHIRKERCLGGSPCMRCVESRALCRRLRGGASSPTAVRGTSLFLDSSSDSTPTQQPAAAAAHTSLVQAPPTAPPIPFHSPPTTILTPHPSIRALAARLRAPQLLSCYFADFHCCWPVLHRGRFLERLDEQPAELVWSVGLVGSLFVDPINNSGGSPCEMGQGREEGGESLRSAAREVHEWLLANLSAHLNQWRSEESETSQASFVVAQALLLNIIYGICTDQTALRLRISSSFSTLTEWVREAGLFHYDHMLAPQEPVSSSSSGCTDESDYERWLELEGKKRLSMSVFRLDASLSIIHDRAPSIRFQEVCVPLQCTLALWDACNADDWRRARLLEPDGRLHATLSSICATATSSATRKAVPILLEEDLELGLCAMQARLWEDTQQRHEEFGNPSDAYAGAAAGGMALRGRMADGSEAPPHEPVAREFVAFGDGWHVQLEHWHRHRERCQQVNTGYAPPAHWCHTRFNTSMLYSLSYVRMHADVGLIGRLSAALARDRGRGMPVSSMASRRLDARVRAWAASQNARVAVRYAAQMFRLYTDEVELFASSYQRIDPFAISCMFRAGLVIWAYARSNLVCDLCSDMAPESSERPSLSTLFFEPRLVCELAQIWGPVDSECIDYWILNGGKASVNGNLLCACALPQLVDAFVAVLRKETAGPVIAMLENLK